MMCKRCPLRLSEEACVQINKYGSWQLTKSVKPSMWSAIPYPTLLEPFPIAQYNWDINPLYQESSLFPLSWVVATQSGMGQSPGFVYQIWIYAIYYQRNGPEFLVYFCLFAFHRLFICLKICAFGRVSKSRKLIWSLCAQRLHDTVFWINLKKSVGKSTQFLLIGEGRQGNMDGDREGGREQFEDVLHIVAPWNFKMTCMQAHSHIALKAMARTGWWSRVDQLLLS